MNTTNEIKEILKYKLPSSWFSYYNKTVKPLYDINPRFFDKERNLKQKISDILILTFSPYILKTIPKNTILQILETIIKQDDDELWKKYTFSLKKENSRQRNMIQKNLNKKYIKSDIERRAKHFTGFRNYSKYKDCMQEVKNTIDIMHTQSVMYIPPYIDGNIVSSHGFISPFQSFIVPTNVIILFQTDLGTSLKNTPMILNLLHSYTSIMIYNFFSHIKNIDDKYGSIPLTTEVKEYINNIHLCNPSFEKKSSMDSKNFGEPKFNVFFPDDIVPNHILLMSKGNGFITGIMDVRKYFYTDYYSSHRLSKQMQKRSEYKFLDEDNDIYKHMISNKKKNVNQMNINNIESTSIMRKFDIYSLYDIIEYVDSKQSKKLQIIVVSACSTKLNNKVIDYKFNKELGINIPKKTMDKVVPDKYFINFYNATHYLPRSWDNLNFNLNLKIKTMQGLIDAIPPNTYKFQSEINTFKKNINKTFSNVELFLIMRYTQSCFEKPIVLDDSDSVLAMKTLVKYALNSTDFEKIFKSELVDTNPLVLVFQYYLNELYTYQQNLRPSTL